MNLPRRICTVAAAVAIAVALTFTSVLSAQQSAASGVRDAIVAGTLPGAQHGDLARYRAALLRLYADSSARPLWIGAAGPTPQARAVLAALTLAPARGLRANDYDGDALAGVISSPAASRAAGAGAEQLLRNDAWLSLSLMRFADQVEHGRIDPRSLGFAISFQRPSRDYAGLVTAISRADDPGHILESLEPPYPRYGALKTVLARYRALAADSTLHAAASLSAQRVIRPGDGWLDAPALARYLTALGELAPSAAAPADTFSGALVDGIRRFQQHHGLEPDGVIGPATTAALRVPLSQRVVQIELALERWRWLPHDLPPRLAVVNIPGFRLYAFDRAQGSGPVARLDVIVGSAYDRRHTPVFVSTMTSVIFQPYWNVPPSIARNEEVPRLRRDPGYAARAGFEIVRGGDEGATIYPLTGANLSRVAAGSLRLRQRPGPTNALGPVKFVFPNAYNVYLHGTPAQSLFDRTRRDFSHGCVRVSDPARLAEFVLEGQAGWNAERIAQAMCPGEPMRTVQLSRPLPVYMLYTTVVPDDAGVANFYPDIYGHDARLARALGLR